MRVVRIIARLNIGGPAIQAITLTKRLEEHGYITTLVRGREEPDEGNMDQLAEALAVDPVLVSALSRNPGPRDVLALIDLVRIIRRQRPHIVHTHAAKAGTLGRLAALIALPRKRSRPVLIHTYHGHSLTGYFSANTTRIYRQIERLLARFTDRLIAVSGEVRDELISLGVADRSKFEVVPLGFDLSPFVVDEAARSSQREALRVELGIPHDARVITLVARLVPIKRVDRFLRVARELREDVPDAYFLVVGDGELRAQLRGSSDAVALGERLVWAGFRNDMPAIYFASDVVAQTSDSEGTPVALIEAQAARVPVVSTAVGGTAAVVTNGETGFVVGRQATDAFARAVRAVATDTSLAVELGRAGQLRSTGLFALRRLVADIDCLYRNCMLDAGSL